MSSSSVNKDEVEKFSSLADTWWDLDGPFKILHEINPIRLEYICSKLGNNLANSSILDVGCGGGLISLPLATLGAKVDAIDASSENIEAAKLHAKIKKSPVKFICNPIEKHKGSYHAIVCLELIEHVDNLEEFVKNIAEALKPGGKIIFSTINRNPKSYALAIGMAEYVLGWVPKKTHDFSKFVKPSELVKILEQNNIIVSDITGMSYNILKRSWGLSRNVDVNYFLFGMKK
jgi:2-polyprenyl-6-hydroxyphenyl methylase/3-demethylubiquinone-9 3-methyltransferase